MSAAVLAFQRMAVDKAAEDAVQRHLADEGPATAGLDRDERCRMLAFVAELVVVEAGATDDFAQDVSVGPF